MLSCVQHEDHHADHEEAGNPYLAVCRLSYEDYAEVDIPYWAACM